MDSAERLAAMGELWEEHRKAQIQG